MNSPRQILRLRRPEARQNVGALRVLTIGVGRYTMLPPLRFSAVDAIDLGQALERQAGEGRLYDGARVISLVDSRASLAEIRNALDSFTSPSGPATRSFWPSPATA